MKIPKFLRKKRNIWIIIILVLMISLGFFFFGRKNNTDSIQTGFAIRQNLQETALSTGQVVSATDLSLSFSGSGIVKMVSVKEGDKAYKGQVLASLDQSSALATLTQAQANYDKLINGATTNDVQSLQDAVNLAKVNLNNVYNSALSALNNGYTAIFNTDAVVKAIQETYFTSADSSWAPVYENRVNISNNLIIAQNNINQANNSGVTDLTISNFSSSLASVLTSLQIIRNQTDTDNYISRVSATDKSLLDSQKTAVSSALSSINSLQSSVASGNVALQTAENNLSVKQSAPRSEDVALAQGQVDAAQAVLNNTVIVAPASGTITKVDIKIGEQATPSKEVIVLQDVGNLHAEANISEASIASLKVGQSIDYTFDALGQDQHFLGKILTINPASTVISGVVNYKVTGSLENIPNIKPGMTVNMTILVAEKNNVLAVPSTAIINKNKKKYVRIVNNDKNKNFHEGEVQTGLQADGGLIEIISGINENQKIIIYMKQ